MNEDELRALVRESLERHLGRAAERGGRGSLGLVGDQAVGGPPVRGPVVLGHAVFRHAVFGHASHARFQVPTGGEGDGPCLIEPAVRCNHCGYCQSFGH